MKVEVEKQPDSVSTLQIELPPEQVAKEWNAIADSFARHAKIPGYRPGKAPRRVIEAKFKKEIQEELTKKLVSKSYRDAVAEKQLRVVSLTNLEDVNIGDDKTMRFRATVITAPEFDLPDYKNITVQLPPLEVTEEEVNTAMERLRDQSADFVEVEPERPLQMDDFAVIDFEGTIEGRLISDPDRPIQFVFAGKAHPQDQEAKRVLQRLIDQRSCLSEMTLMLQREVVDRITAAAGETERGYLSVLVEAYCEAEQLFDVAPQAFRPVPKVWSTVVNLRVRPKIKADVNDEALLWQVVSAGFAQRRKTILNNLRDAPAPIQELLKKRGGASIVGPGGHIVAGPLPPGEDILYADVHADDVIIPKFIHDFAGHYNRPELFAPLFDRLRESPEPQNQSPNAK